MDDLRQFHVEIPTRHIVQVPFDVWQRFDAAMRSMTKGHIYRSIEPMYDRDAFLVEGEATPLMVTGLMALAQGHDLLPIIEQIEAQV